MPQGDESEYSSSGSSTDSSSSERSSEDEMDQTGSPVFEEFSEPEASVTESSNSNNAAIPVEKQGSSKSTKQLTMLERLKCKERKGKK